MKGLLQSHLAGRPGIVPRHPFDFEANV